VCGTYKAKGIAQVECVVGSGGVRVRPFFYRHRLCATLVARGGGRRAIASYGLFFANWGHGRRGLIPFGAADQASHIINIRSSGDMEIFRVTVIHRLRGQDYRASTSVSQASARFPEQATQSNLNSKANLALSHLNLRNLTFPNFT